MLPGLIIVAGDPSPPTCILITQNKPKVKKMTVRTESIELSTAGNGEVHDITDQVGAALRSADLRNGLVTVFCPSATSALTTLEYETGCVRDLQRLFDEIIDPRRDYAHNARWGDGNGHSHIRAALLKPSLTIPFVDGRMTLGTWQQIVYVDFDNRPRQRRLVVQVMGE
jgi:secondary thiamine-phosphate synthase enzyme